MWLLSALFARAADESSLPTFRSYAGTFLINDGHNYLVESELHLPLWQAAPVNFYYRHRETTPFREWNEQVRAEVLHQHDEVQTDCVLHPFVRAIFVAGYQRSQWEDKPGKLSAYAFGAGLGSTLYRDWPRVAWQVIAGGYADRENVPAIWWVEASGTWRVMDFMKDTYLGSRYRAGVAVTGELELIGNDDRSRGVYRLGPELQLTTANGNEARMRCEWYRNDDNPFYGSDENGLLFGFELSSMRDDQYIWRAWENRQPGWLPLCWGSFDAGVGDRYWVQHFEINAELVDVAIADHLVTGTVWFETRQEHRYGDYDNIQYSVTLGVQSAVGWETILSQHQPLVVGADFLHRSDHALDPDDERVPATGLIKNGSANVLPRFRLQTLGWDLPYRDPSIYDRRTAWLHQFDWRVTGGWNIGNTHQRGKVSGQLGLSWDIAAVQGYVCYARGLVSGGNETPDASVEFGVRRPAFKLFGRYEDYGVTSTIARGATFTIGLGAYL